ncbi:hypothetical protein DL93DRAFT_2049976 [Clavulina sp. PMI_390]|nr:hypothetical protein DL93DRAFT_2049976 [Clavulina sp. PMI_390]
MAPLETLVQEWLSLDQNPDTRREIEELWAARNEAELERRLRKRIEFGTAGLRARMEAGFSRMNDVTVIQASQGLAAYLAENVADAESKGVVIGYDHRHHSERFAYLTATAFLGRNFKVYLHRGIVHTPLVPFTVARLKAAGGIMITASHNPKDDNGYKVYWENAVQIINPHDTGIAAAIERNLVPRTWDTASVTSSSMCLDVTSEMKAAYFKTLESIGVSMDSNPSCSVKFVNTSMHGVGNAFVESAWKAFGFPPYIPCKVQMNPDPDFPTVKFPNPEEKGEPQSNEAMKEADAAGAQYVLAQDPDADRFTAAQKLPDGTWRQFSGDQIGAILASWSIECYRRRSGDLNKLAMVASTVSSKMLEAMAAKEGFKFVESLTGFKYIGNAALELIAQGYQVPFAYEEAIGFMLNTGIHDKDGVAASVFFAELVAWLHTKGSSIAIHLDELYKKYGYFETSNSYFFCSDPSTVDRIFGRLRAWSPGADVSSASYPTSIAGLTITRVRDLTVGHAHDSSNPPSFEPDLPLSGGHMITFRAEQKGEQADALRIVLTIRTSGTEPKIKYYLEATGAHQEQVRNILSAVVNELSESWMEATKNGITRP